MSDGSSPIVTVLPRGAQRVVPWRNGGGSTREVAIDPPAATVQSGFRWRISIAGVAADGPFSRFAGIDRSLWLLAGDGLLLDVEDRVAGCVDGEPVRLDRAMQRFDFAGETAIRARLLGGPTEDLNVMSDRAAVDAAAEIVTLAARQRLHRRLPTGQHVVLVVSGEVDLAIAEGVLGTGDAVRIDGTCALEAVVQAAPATLLIATFCTKPTGTARAT